MYVRMYITPDTWRGWDQMYSEHQGDKIAALTSQILLISHKKWLSEEEEQTMNTSELHQ